MVPIIQLQPDRRKAQQLADRWLSENMQQRATGKVSVLMALTIAEEIPEFQKDIATDYDKAIELLPQFPNTPNANRLKYEVLAKAACFFVRTDPAKSLKTATAVLNYCLQSVENKQVFYLESQTCILVYFNQGRYVEALNKQLAMEKLFMKEPFGDLEFKRSFYLNLADAMICAESADAAATNYRKSGSYAIEAISGVERDFAIESSRKLARISGVSSGDRRKKMEQRTGSNYLARIGQRLYHLNKEDGRKLFAEGIKLSPAADLLEKKAKLSEKAFSNIYRECGDWEEWIENSEIATDMGLLEEASLCACIALDSCKMHQNKNAIIQMYEQFACNSKIATTLLDLKRPAEAEVALQRGISAVQLPDEDVRNAVICHYSAEFAWAAYKNGFKDLSRKMSTSAAAHRPTQSIHYNPLLCAQLARAYEVLEDKSSAEKYWKQTVSAAKQPEFLADTHAVTALGRATEQIKLMRILMSCHKVSEAEKLIAQEGTAKPLGALAKSSLLAEMARIKLKNGDRSKCIPMLEEAHRLYFSSGFIPNLNVMRILPNIELKLLIAECRKAKIETD